ncbi:MAG: efflux RND transporter periplasmic adaptor subunit [Sphingomonadales bacterium]
MPNITVVGGLIIFFLGLLLAISGIRNSPQAQDSSYNSIVKPELVETYTVIASTTSYKILSAGRLRPQFLLNVVSEVSGKITYVNPMLKTGGRFFKGDTLLRINDTPFKAEVARSEANLESAEAQLIKSKADYSRTVSLFENGNTSEAVKDGVIAYLRASQANVKKADAQLTLAKETLKKTIINAPFEVLVIKESVSPDGFVTPGKILAELMDANMGEIAISLQPSEMTAVARTYQQNGEKPISVIARPGNGAVGSLSIKGLINRISPVVDATSRTGVIIAEFENVFSQENVGRVFGDDFMTVEIEAKSDEPLWQVPYGAIRKSAFIWTVSNENKIHRKDVTVQWTGDGMALVSSQQPLVGERILMTFLPEEIEGKFVRISESR